MKPLAIIAALFLFPVFLFGSADLVTTTFPPTQPIRAGYASGVAFQVQNKGPETATAVTLSISSTIPNTCSCNLGDIPAGQSRTASVSFVAPESDATITFSGTASSSTPDPNSANNSASVVVTVAADPDLGIALAVPLIQDLALPFTATVFLSNSSHTTAHDVEVTVDFSGEGVTVKSLPDGCSSPTSGRVVCRLDSLPPSGNAPGPKFPLQLIAPVVYGDGSVTFRAVVTEREHDFDPVTNAVTQTMGLYNTFYVFNTNNDGSGSLRQAIVDANGRCSVTDRCAIAFHIDQSSAKPWKSIAVTSPLPPVTAPHLRIDGATQTAFFGDTNPDGPEIEITGSGTLDSDGLLIANCGAEVANLALNGFVRNGISVTQATASQCVVVTGTSLHHLFIGTDATGSTARPNARGIGTSFQNGSSSSISGLAINITDNVISGNLHSGIFGMSGRLKVARNRIGVKAHSDEPLPNGNAGVFIGLGGYGSDVGISAGFRNFTPGEDGNVIAFNGEMGVAVARGVANVSIRNNRIWGNKLLGIDIGLDGPTQTGAGVVTMPAITLAHYDPVSRQTVIEGDFEPGGSTFNDEIEVYANDAPDPTGLGEGQRPVGVVRVQTGPPPNRPNHFRVAVDGDLTGQFVSATLTRAVYTGFAKPEGIDELVFTQTSEFSPTVPVQ
jgi:hypothetical protein